MVANKSERVTAKPATRATYFPYIGAAACELGIARVTLWRILKGQYPDHGDYAARYRAFVAAVTAPQEAAK